MNALLTYWQWNGAALFVVVLLTAFYLWTHHFKWNKKGWFFLTALLVFVLCFFSPLHILSEEYLFSAHMAVHVLLLLVLGPLLVTSFSKSWSQQRWCIRLSRLLHKKIFIGWIIGIGIMWFWHLPFVFNYSMHTNMQPNGFQGLRAIESISLIASGMLFSWPLIAPAKPYRIAPLSGVVYLFTACIACSLLGLLITFAPAGMYHHFLSMHDTFQLNNIIQNRWGVTQAMDQQTAGLIMWVPCCFLYVVYALYLLGTWLNEKDAREKFVLHDR